MRVFLKGGKKMKGCLLITLIFFMLVSVVTAQDPPKSILKPGDVKHFIKTFPLLKEDIIKHGIKYDAQDGTITIPEAIKSRNEFLEILKKHGWDEHFFTKMATITLGFQNVQYGAGIKKASPEIEKAIKELEANKALSAEMKEMLKKQMLAAKGIMKSQQEYLKKRIHKADMDLIRPLIKELKKVMEAD